MPTIALAGAWAGSLDVVAGAAGQLAAAGAPGWSQLEGAGAGESQLDTGPPDG